MLSVGGVRGHLRGSCSRVRPTWALNGRISKQGMGAWSVPGGRQAESPNKDEAG